MRRTKLWRVLAAGLLAVTAGLAAPVLAEPAKPALAWDNGLALTPPMGWNTWNTFECDISEDLVRETADLMVAEGWLAAGYNYVNLDDCWSAKQRDSSGNLVADPVRFPSGIKALADYVHAKGMKFGIYADNGTRTCAGYPGSHGFETRDAALFASWDVDYIKYDNCAFPADADGNPLEPHQVRYKRMQDAIIATGRPMILAICEWGQSHPWNWGPSVGNLWRTTGDIQPWWGRIDHIYRLNVPAAWAAKPGAWNDPDMLEIGSTPWPDRPALTYDEMRSHFSLWAMMNAPLIAGADLRNLPADLKAIHLNRDVIAINQDPLGEQARQIYVGGTENLVYGERHVLVKPLANGDRVVALFNRSDTTQSMSTTANYLSLPASSQYTVTDLWSKQVTTTTGAISRTVKPHETVLLRVRANTPGPGGWTRQLVSKSSGKCLDDPNSSTGNNTEVIIYACTNGVNEQWTYTPGKQLQVMGKCLDAYNRGTTPNTRVVLYTCNGQANQQWNVTADGKIIGVQSGLCLDVYNNETANSTPVILYTCKNAPNQIWTRR
ncbi:ricin-type beta-trefoil lectin domain protein [Actinoplanes sp. NPDC024001]|uniref:glycoside hydrolase family 27 protein n=1 Tax=Actinoplanes sp. NPDC024001 TaxID=3154598 RepID=UPI0033C6A736